MKDLLTLTALSPEAEKLAESGRGSVRGILIKLIIAFSPGFLTLYLCV